VKGQSIRVTIGDVSAWSIAEAQAEARRLQVLIDHGHDPRQVEADRRVAEEAKATALKSEKESKLITVAEAWEAYTAERSASMKDGKLEWGERHQGHLRYFLQAGGVKRTRGRRPNEPDITRPGVLVPFMTMRLADVDAQVVVTWLEKEVALAPATTAKAFSVLRAFLTWCTKKEEYRAAVKSNPCLSVPAKGCA
jgi:hypothetical protein